MTNDSKHSRPEGQPSGRRYGLFGVSAYPQKSPMDQKQRDGMVRALGVVIVLIAAAVILLMLFSQSSPGLTVTFDTMGGSELPSQSIQYGGTVEPPGETVRPGYVLEGWSIAPEGAALWDFEHDIVTDTLTLYAVWSPQ